MLHIFQKASEKPKSGLRDPEQFQGGWDVNKRQAGTSEEVNWPLRSSIFTARAAAVFNVHNGCLIHDLQMVSSIFR